MRAAVEALAGAIGGARPRARFPPRTFAGRTPGRSRSSPIPEKPQNDLAVAFPGAAGRPWDAAATRLILYLLGETGYAGRLGKALVDPGLVYSVRATLEGGASARHLQVRTAASAADTPEVLARIRRILDDAAEGGFTEAELAEAKAYLRGKRARSRDGSVATAAALVEEASEAPPDADAVTLAQLNDTARRLFARGAPLAVIGAPGAPRCEPGLTPRQRSGVRFHGIRPRRELRGGTLIARFLVRGGALVLSLLVPAARPRPGRDHRPQGDRVHRRGQVPEDERLLRAGVAGQEGPGCTSGRRRSPTWYYVEMTSDAPCFSGVLLKPSKALIDKRIFYYVDVQGEGPAARPSTPRWSWPARRTARAGCPSRPLSATGPAAVYPLLARHRVRRRWASRPAWSAGGVAAVAVVGGGVWP